MWIQASGPSACRRRTPRRWSRRLSRRGIAGEVRLSRLAAKGARPVDKRETAARLTAGAHRLTPPTVCARRSVRAMAGVLTCPGVAAWPGTRLPVPRARPASNTGAAACLGVAVSCPAQSTARRLRSARRKGDASESRIASGAAQWWRSHDVFRPAIESACRRHRVRLRGCVRRSMADVGRPEMATVPARHVAC